MAWAVYILDYFQRAVSISTCLYVKLTIMCLSWFFIYSLLLLQDAVISTPVIGTLVQIKMTQSESESTRCGLNCVKRKRVLRVRLFISDQHLHNSSGSEWSLPSQYKTRTCRSRNVPQWSIQNIGISSQSLPIYFFEVFQHYYVRFYCIGFCSFFVRRKCYCIFYLCGEWSLKLWVNCITSSCF